jgi:hypothetical protein
MPTKTKEHQPNEVLSLRDNAKNQLLEIKSVEEGITYLNKLKSIEVWVQAEKKDAELQNMIAEQKLRTQRILGELIQEHQRKGILVVKQDNLKQGSEVPDGNIGKKTLDEFGLTRKQSAAFQAISQIPEEQFEDFLSKGKQKVNEAVEELTTAGALRLAKSLGRCPTLTVPQSPMPFKEDSTPDDQIKELANYINFHFTKEQRATLITLIYPH